ncbi:MAG: DnaD domain protein [Firmicutes bacterium]|nr:DnaD domain protein [Bacillota bacterium]
MNFTKRSISQYILFDTDVENIFISEYMPKAPENCVKAYLMGLMYARMGQSADDAVLARSLGLSPSELTDCWRYWEDEGLLIRRMGSEGVELEFVSIREQAFGLPEAASEEPKARILGDAEAKKLYSSIETLTGSLLSAQDIEEIGTWVLSYGMSPSFIMAGYDYSREKGRSTACRYVGKILKDWKAMGLSTEEDVREYLSDMDRHYELYRKVFRALGFKYNPTLEQKRLMDSWTDELGFSAEKILEACAKTVSISNPNIKYVDSVLRGWSEEAKKPQKAASKTDLIARVMELYKKDREENEKKTSEQRARIYKEIPRVEAIEGEMKEASYRLSRALFTAGGEKLAEAQRKKLKELTDERSSLLKAAGYSENAVDRIYTCSRCRDTGLLEDDSRCPCFDEKLALVQSGLLE